MSTYCSNHADQRPTLHHVVRWVADADRADRMGVLLRAQSDLTDDGMRTVLRRVVAEGLVAADDLASDTHFAAAVAYDPQMPDHVRAAAALAVARPAPAAPTKVEPCGAAGCTTWPATIRPSTTQDVP